MKKNSILLHLLLMALVTFGLGIGVVFGLSSYTKHGEQVTVPELRGKTLPEVVTALANIGLEYEVVDSIYEEHAKAGSIREVTPSAGSKVKPGRIIFLSTYAYSPRPLTLPFVTNMSARQALAMLRAAGFENITTKQVPGEYRDLCMGVTDTNGKAFPSDARLNKNTPLVLQISGLILDSLNTSELIDTLSGTVWNPDAYTTEEPIYTPTRPTQPDTTTTQQDEPETWW